MTGRYSWTPGGAIRSWLVYLEEEIRMELSAACSADARYIHSFECILADVNKLLFEFVGPTILDTATKDQLMSHIRKIAVKGLHKELHRMNFGKIKQGDGESVTHFVARLNAQTALCNFSVTCSCAAEVSFAEDMVFQQLVSGLRDQNHQSKVLAEATSLKTLQLKVERLQSLEATEESATKLQVPSAPSSAAAGKSSYKKAASGGAPKKTSESKDKKKLCATCGKSSHFGRSMSFKDCPASQKGKTCNTCGKEVHFASVCKSKTKAAMQKQDEEDRDIDEQTSSTYLFATHIPIHDQGSQSDF